MNMSQSEASATHLVLMPSYNTGAALLGETIRSARAQWAPILIVIDGSTDGSGAIAQALAQNDPGLRVLVSTKNQGKGAAILMGLREAERAGFTHVLTMDSDGQHPADRIKDFMAISLAAPDAVVLGCPEFDRHAPKIRVFGRQISNWWTNLETLWTGIGDSLFGFRLYPIGPLLRLMNQGHWMRGFDFEPEVAVRLCWAGVPVINLSVPVRYLTREEGGVSHFNYLRDNILLIGMNLRLLIEFALRLPAIIAARAKAGGARSVLNASEYLAQHSPALASNHAICQD